MHEVVDLNYDGVNNLLNIVVNQGGECYNYTLTVSLSVGDKCYNYTLTVSLSIIIVGKLEKSYHVRMSFVRKFSKCSFVTLSMI